MTCEAKQKKLLRRWQTEALEAYFRHTAPDFLAVVTPGAGKTRFALEIAKRRIMEGCRLIVVVPTLGIKNQWISVAASEGIILGNEWGHGHITTYQQCVNGEHWREISEDTFVIIDEIHHAADDKSWGDAVTERFGLARWRLHLTGTAFRSDDCSISFLRYEGGVLAPDYVYDYGPAVKDGVVRRLAFITQQGSVKYLKNEVEIEADVLKAPLKVVCDPILSIARAMLIDADRMLARRPTAKGLVLCRDGAHARAVLVALEEITNGPPVALALHNEGGTKVIEEFRDDSRRWIVAVRQISEGVDIPRCDTVVYLTDYKTALFFRQGIARALRMMAEGETGFAYCFLPGHKSLLRHKDEIEVHLEHELTGETVEEKAGVGTGSQFDRATIEALEASVGKRTVENVKSFAAPIPFEGAEIVWFEGPTRAPHPWMARMARRSDESKERQKIMARVENLTPEQLDRKRKKSREYGRESLINLTPEQRARANEKKRLRRLNLSPEELEQKRANGRSKAKLRRKSLTPEQKEQILARNRISNLTPEQIENKRLAQRVENLSPEQIEWNRKRRSKANLTPEQLDRKRKVDREAKARELLKKKQLTSVTKSL